MTLATRAVAGAAVGALRGQRGSWRNYWCEWRDALARAARFGAAESALMLVLAAGTALLFTFLFLGRPPFSVPTLAGLRVFLPMTLALFFVFQVERYWFERVLIRNETRGGVVRVQGKARRLMLLGNAPLMLAWPLTGSLYHDVVHHWFVVVESVRPAIALTVLIPTLALKVGVLIVGAGRDVSAWCWRYRYAMVGTIYAGAALAAKPSLWHGDLPAWFVPAAKMVLAGRPLEMFSVRALEFGRPVPLEHGPLGIFFYSPFIAIAELVGKTDFFCVGALFPLAGVLAVDLLLVWQIERAIRDMAPRISPEQRFGIFVLVLFSPLLWFSSVWLLHLESLTALLLIGSVRCLGRRKAVWAGILFGGVLLIKHSGALAIGPVLLVLALNHHFRLAFSTGVVTAAVMLAGLVPFALAAPEDFYLNFVGYDAIKLIYGVTIWKVIYESGLEPLVMRFDNQIIGALALASGAGLGLMARRQQKSARDTSGVDDDQASNSVVPVELCWIAIVLGQITWLGLATWQYPHYFVVGFVALLIWETASLARREESDRQGTGGWPVLSLLFLFVPFNLQAHFPSNVGKAGGAFVVARATAQLLFLYGCAVAVWVRASRRR